MFLKQASLLLQIGDINNNTRILQRAVLQPYLHNTKIPFGGNGDSVNQLTVLPINT